MIDIEKRKVLVDKLRWQCDPKIFSFDTTKELEPLEGIIGQERALSSLKTGLEIDNAGYNIFVSGLVGTGRMTIIKKTLENFLKPGSVPDDLCYVNNFNNPDMPSAISLPPGDGKKFKKVMSDLISDLKKELPRVLNGQEFKNSIKNVAEEYRAQQKELINRVRLRAQQEGFSLVQIQMGPITRPVLMPNFQNQPTPLERLENMVEQGEFPRDRFEELKEKSFQLNSDLETTQRSALEIERELGKRIEKIEAETVKPIIEQHLKSVREAFSSEKISTYLDQVQSDIAENLHFFKEDEAPANAQMPFPLFGVGGERNPFWRYDVNLLVDNSSEQRRPVIIETTPTYANLFGTIDRSIDRTGAIQTDFTKLKAGSIHRANGGYLILNAYDLLTEPGSWRCLKRVLKNRKIEFQCMEPIAFFASLSIKPEPIDSVIKVILIGDSYLYHLLLDRDEDFSMIFKIKSDFDPVMEKNAEHIKNYAAFVKKITEDDNLLPFNREAMAEIVEYGVRETRSQRKMSTRLSEVADLVREASYWAEKDNREVVQAADVSRALSEKVKRVNLVEDKIKERILEGVLMIETEGKQVGQVNGLAVYSLGNHNFGLPSKITAVTSLGRAGIINIEREAKLSGNIHDKGVLILSGYLRGRYAQELPLTISASLCFEQSYYGVEGDSASSTELYALISSIIGIPLRQDIAVTGSVNQKGEIQPIGGVNEKIEGFFDVCKDRGLTGTQGVMIPKINVEDLMLKNEVVDAVGEGKFTIYQVSSIDEGIEILTGMPAGSMKEDGSYPEGTVNYQVVKKLKEIHLKLKRLDKREDREGEKNKKD